MKKAMEHDAGAARALSSKKVTNTLTTVLAKTVADYLWSNILDTRLALPTMAFSACILFEVFGRGLKDLDNAGPTL